MTNLKRLTINSISSVRIVAAVAIVYLALNSIWWLVLIFAIIGFVSDFIDGRLARYWQVSSAFGAFFDPLTDKILCLTIIAVVAVVISPLFWLLFAVFAVYDITTMSLRTLMSKYSSMPTSYIAKVKTALMMLSLVLIIISAVLESGVLSVLALVLGAILLLVTSVLTVMSLIKYLRYVSHQILHQWLEFPSHVDKIDFQKWHQKYGINAVFFDIEGTLTHWAGTEIENEMVVALQKARSAGIKHIALITNIHSNQSDRVSKIANQIGADNFQVPYNHGERKPNPAMAYKALKKLHISADETAFVGDKLVDVITGKRTGMKRVAWVDRFGIQDHPFDRYIYRHFERVIKYLIR